MIEPRRFLNRQNLVVDGISNLLAIPLLLYFILEGFPFARTHATSFLGILAVVVALSNTVQLVAIRSISGTLEGFLAGRVPPQEAALALDLLPANQGALMFLRWLFGGSLLFGSMIFLGHATWEEAGLLMLFTVITGTSNGAIAYLRMEMAKATLRYSFAQNDHALPASGAGSVSVATKCIVSSLLNTLLPLGTILTVWLTIRHQKLDLQDLRLGLLLIFVQATVLSVLIGVSLSGLLQSALRTITGFLREIADRKGDLTRDLPVLVEDETGAMIGQFNAFIATLRQLMGKVLDSSATVSGASGVLSRTSNSLAAGAEELASQSTTIARATREADASSQTIAASVEELSVTFRNLSRSLDGLNSAFHQVVEHCRDESEKARAAADSSEQARSDMGRLSASMNQVAEVVDFIQEIASQTNLLALNAAIESARAGEAGKGFGVVANEVKELANQTRQATSKIVDHVQQMVALVERCSRSMETIDSGIREVNEISKGIVQTVQMQAGSTAELTRDVQASSMATQQITEALQQNAQGLKEITRNIQELNQVVQTTTQGVSTVHDQSRTMQDQATSLTGAISVFRV